MRGGLIRSGRKGFSLLEVLIALALAAIVMGVTLSAISHDTMAVAQASNRYQSMIWAGQALEIKMEQQSASGSSSTISDPGASTIGTSFITNVTQEPVIADPRVERVHVQVGAGTRASQGADAFHLRVRRAASTATNTSAATTSATTPTGGASH